MNREIIINYNWAKKSDGSTEICAAHQEALDETTRSIIAGHLKDDLTSGELKDNIRMTDDDPEEGIAYVGSWSMTMKNSTPIRIFNVFQEHPEISDYYYKWRETNAKHRERDIVDVLRELGYEMSDEDKEEFAGQYNDIVGYFNIEVKPIK